jgi:hypothetical protein
VTAYRESHVAKFPTDADGEPAESLGPCPRCARALAAWLRWLLDHLGLSSTSEG